MRKTLSIFFVTALVFLVACGGSVDKKYAGFQIEMPDSLLGLVNADSENDIIRVTAAVEKVNEAGEPLTDKFGAPIVASKVKDMTSTIRGHYVIPVSGLKKERSYRFQLKIYQRANAYAAPAISASAGSALKADDVPVDLASPVFITTNVTGCPEPVEFSPDGSLGDGEWLLLCEVDTVLPFKKYDPTDPMKISEEAIVCTGDADGDGTPNLTEVDSLLDPYNGDYDGDCTKDSEDAFPDNPNERLDTDGDGLGNNEDLDADNDGASDDEEQAAGTDPIDSDSDDDGVIDGSDNCGLVSNGDQGNVDEDAMGDFCDDDSDNDDLSDDRESELLTNPRDADSDDDGLNDGREVDTDGTDPLDPDSDDDGRVDGVDRFPKNITEWEDTDNDGVGDNADNCDTTPNADQANMDGDSMGDACDSDDDGDGVSDVIENRIGSNPLNADTDGDTLTDWFGGTVGENSDPCLLDPAASGDDVDGDGFGSICDLSDDPAADPSADEVNFDAIFAAAETGNDGNSGSRTAPVRTLTRAMTLASSSGKATVYATGDFELSETLDLVEDVSLYGGFSSGFSERDPADDPSRIFSSALSTLVQAEDLSENASLDGFSLEISNTLHATAIDAVDSTITLANNAITVADGSGTGTAISLDGCEGSITNNDIRVEDFNNRFGIACISAGDSAITLSGNTVDVWTGVAFENVNFVYLQDCVSGVSRLRYDPLLASPFGTLTGLTNSGGNLLDGLY